MLVAGVDERSSRRALELTELEGVHAAAGVHPNSSAGWEDRWIEPIAGLIGGGAVAVGETGLDFFRDAAPAPDQRAAFAAHLELAKGAGKALVIHTRASVDEALDMLEEHSPPERFVFHCWSGDDAQLARALALDAYVSFAGNVTFASAEALRRLAASVPADRLLVETDAPYLSPTPFRGKPNEPARVVVVGEAVAAARGDDAGRVAEDTHANALRLFGIGR